MAQSVERVLGKDEVTSSNLVSSSKNAVSGKLTAFFVCAKSRFSVCSTCLRFRYMGRWCAAKGEKPFIHWQSGLKNFAVPLFSQIEKAALFCACHQKELLGIQWCKGEGTI